MSKKKKNPPLERDAKKERLLTEQIMRPEVRATETLAEICPNYDMGDGTNFRPGGGDILAELEKQNQALRTGDLTHVEHVLNAQIQTLDRLFNNYVVKLFRTERMDTLKAFSNIAFTAQRQCRCTAEALAEIKNPRPYIQNNKGQYVQVNNGEQPQSKPHAHAEENSKSTNGLMELEDKTHEQEWLDTGAPEEAGGNDKELETVGVQHRAKDG